MKKHEKFTEKAEKNLRKKSSRKKCQKTHIEISLPKALMLGTQLSITINRK